MPEPEPVGPDQAVTAAWNLLQQARANFTSLETRAAIIAPSVVGGLIAVWTQLDSFSSGVERSLVWTSWAVLLGATALLATLIAPRRALHALDSEATARLGTDGQAGGFRDELVLVTRMLQALERQTRRLQIALEVSIGLSMLGLGLIAVAYVIKKT